MFGEMSGSRNTEESAANYSVTKPDPKLENLLEQLRAKHAQAATNDSWNDFAKQIRMASLV